MAVPSRRDRHREKTRRDIKRVARRQLVAEGPGAIALRAIARELGMTAPGLYRYYASLEDLVGALIADYYDEVVAAMVQVRDGLPAEDSLGRLIAVSREFRRWSLAHPAEFGLIFATPLPGFTRPPEGAPEWAGTRFGAVFREIFTDLWTRRPFPLPLPGTLDPHLLDQLADPNETRFGPLPPGAVYVFVACWVRVYGAVAMEVFGQLKWALEEGGALFETELRQLAALMGMPAQYRPPS